MPGLSLRSLFGTSMIVPYVVTFCTTTGCKRICATVPTNSSVGYASTWNVTLCPGRIRPTSASSMLAFTCILVRSAAMMKSVGDCRLAATVCPTSTLRCMTIPSMGAWMIV